MDQILIKDLLVRTVIGIDEHERTHLSDVMINLVIFTDIGKAGVSDDIDDCINYVTLIHQVQALVEKAGRHTVEALAEDIAQFCLEIPGVNGVKVRVEKPKAVHFTQLVGVEIER
jgi:FolB domain-containing protein